MARMPSFLHRELTESLDMAQSTVMRLQCVARDSRARKVTVAPSYVGRYSLALCLSGSTRARATGWLGLG